MWHCKVVFDFTARTIRLRKTMINFGMLLVDYRKFDEARKLLEDAKSCLEGSNNWPSDWNPWDRVLWPKRNRINSSLAEGTLSRVYRTTCRIATSEATLYAHLVRIRSPGSTAPNSRGTLSHTPHNHLSEARTDYD